MIVALLLSVGLTAAPTSDRLTYENKCLYCHSEEVSEQRPLTEAKWRQVIEQMRRKAPLLITRGDVPLLTKYMTQTLKLLAPSRPRTAAPRSVQAVEPKVIEPKVAEPKVAELKIAVEPVVPEPASVEVAPPDEPPTTAELALEEEGFTLMQHRCAKCHTLGRVYGKLDSFEKSRAILERMRFKTGSGITDHDFKLLENYLRAQF